MKDTKNTASWFSAASAELNHTELRVFMLWYTDAPSYSAGSPIISTRSWDKISIQNVSRAFRGLVKKGFLEEAMVSMNQHWSRKSYALGNLETIEKRILRAQSEHFEVSLQTQSDCAADTLSVSTDKLSVSTDKLSVSTDKLSVSTDGGTIKLRNKETRKEEPSSFLQKNAPSGLSPERKNETGEEASPVKLPLGQTKPKRETAAISEIEQQCIELLADDTFTARTANTVNIVRSILAKLQANKAVSTKERDIVQQQHAKAQPGPSKVKALTPEEQALADEEEHRIHMENNRRVLERARSRKIDDDKLTALTRIMVESGNFKV